MSASKLPTPLVRVYFVGEDKPTEVQTILPDLTAWDRIRTRHKWGRADEVPVMWQAFVTYSACKRLGITAQDVGFDTWEQTVAAIEPVDNDEIEDGDAVGDPTPLDQ